MPILFKKQESAFLLGIWRMDEHPDELLKRGLLSAKDVEKVKSFQSIARKKEWICTRLMLHEMMPGKHLSIIYDENGKPHLENSTAHISVSHTKNFVGVIISEKHPVGIDIELIHPRIEKIAHRFVSEEEMLFIDKKNPLHCYFVLWGVKEALYKMYGKGELIFKEHLHVKPFKFNISGEIKASILKGDLNKEYSLNYELMNDLLLIYVVDQANQ
jgi:4'-phosphopantetheinyl transferase